MTPQPVYPLMSLVACLAGPIIWAAHFMALYGMQATVCSRLKGDTALSVQVIGGALSGMALIALLLVGLSEPAQRRGFLGLATRLLLWLSAPGIVWASLTLLMIPACAP